MTSPVSQRHVCWSYDDPAELHACARDYLGAGLAAGERVWFAAAGGPGELAGWLADAARHDPGAVRFVPLEIAYPSGVVADPRAQVAAYAAATGEALADGYAGLRVVAECTPLVRTAEGLEAFARYEALVEPYIATSPMRAVCALHRPELGDFAVGELACLHPATNAAGIHFALHGDPPCLTGELDMAAEPFFPAALRRVQPPPQDGRIVIGADDLRFIDHRALLHLQHYAEEHDTVVVLRTALGTAACLAELLGLSRVRIEATR
ncbi:MEDS domain-containing protein [Dactylosporangium sp. CA-233914]|uniref:MEDS domain-containing protein n=1 Tax=Dactylosporangium sp. CA-233914 TaxID=3239934 RepID=UPI003D8EEE27